MWKIYDELIAAIPPGLTVRECLLGLNWTLVRSRTTGIAMTYLEGHPSVELAGEIAGMPLRQLAEYVKSWNFLEAAVGLAAINSYFNTPEQVEKLCGRPISEQKQVNAFTYFQEQLRGKKVAVIGHFPDLESLAGICRLAVLERRPQPGDYPDPACEYILPQQDYVFLTATTLVNKTLPRLLELSRQAVVVLVGPSTPLTPILFQYGVNVLAGTVVVDPVAVRQVVQEGGSLQLFQRGGQMVKISKEEVQEG